MLTRYHWLSDEISEIEDRINSLENLPEDLETIMYWISTGRLRSIFA